MMEDNLENWQKDTQQVVDYLSNLAKLDKDKMTKEQQDIIYKSLKAAKKGLSSVSKDITNINNHLAKMQTKYN